MGQEKLEIRIEQDLTAEVLSELANRIPIALEAVGVQMENNARIHISREVYNKPRAKSGYKRTGNLRNSITHQVDRKEQAAVVGTNVEYAVFVEMGTVKYPKARPYIKPALEDHKQEYINIIKDYLSR